MKLSKSVRPISYLKSKTADAIKEVTEGQTTLVITQNGEAKAVLQDIVDYERTQESLALLKILSQSMHGYYEGKSKNVRKSFADIKRRVKEYKD